MLGDALRITRVALALWLGTQVGCSTTPAPRTAPPAAPAAANRPPMVRITCKPCTVPPGGDAALIGQATDPDGDALTYVWRSAGGTLDTTTGARVVWRAPASPGPVPVVVTVSDGRGGAASDSVTLTVMRPGGDAAPRRQRP